MAKSKYTSERKERILARIREDGGDRAGWEAGSISKDTFYRWIAEFPDFSDGVARAKEEFRQSCPKHLVVKARRSLSDYLFNGNIIEREKTGESVKVIEDASGNIQEIHRETYTEKRIDRMPPPQWVIERILGKNLAVLEAIQVLLAEGVATNEQARVVTDGISRIEEQLKALPGSDETKLAGE